MDGWMIVTLATNPLLWSGTKEQLMKKHLPFRMKEN
jgi:hypothetical protein